MFGRDNLKEIREALDAAGSDMGSFKSWQKKYERMEKKMNSVREQYGKAHDAAVEVESIVREMEKMIVSNNPADKETQRIFAELVKDLKRLQNACDHEFVVSREDKEFHSTYGSILKLGAKALDKSDQCLILQSEIENLLALLKENLQKEAPRLYALCFFYQEHSDDELVDLPPAERVRRIAYVYQTDFVLPMEEMLREAIAIADVRAGALSDRQEKRGAKEAEKLRILWNEPGEHKSVSDRAKRILEELIYRL